MDGPSLSVTLFLLHKFSASASVSSGSVSFDAFYVAKEPIVDVETDFEFRSTKNDGARSFVRRLFSTDIGAFVDDTGDGIDPSIKEKIFEKFITLDRTISDGKRGIGLGLAICKAIVEAHGGRIFAMDNEPTGTCMVFTLPLDQEA